MGSSSIRWAFVPASARGLRLLRRLRAGVRLAWRSLLVVTSEHRDLPQSPERARRQWEERAQASEAFNWIAQTNRRAAPDGSENRP